MQGREEGSCIFYLPGFRCKGKHLDNKGQAKHFRVWKYSLHVNWGIHDSSEFDDIVTVLFWSVFL